MDLTAAKRNAAPWKPFSPVHLPHASLFLGKVVLILTGTWARLALPPFVTGRFLLFLKPLHRETKAVAPAAANLCRKLGPTTVIAVFLMLFLASSSPPPE